MGFFDKMLSKVGIGAAKVDTILNSSLTKPGGLISGVVHVKGGNVDQDISDIDVSLMVDVKVENDYYESNLIYKHRVTGSFKIHKGENRQFPFEFNVPLEVPITVLGPYKLRNINLYVKTDLDIENALDKADIDYLEIEPLPTMVNFLNAIINLGFTFHEADVEKGRLSGSNYDFFQEIEFKPSNNFVEELTQLSKLTWDEVISEEEFKSQKSILLLKLSQDSSLVMTDALRMLKELEEEEIITEFEFNETKQNLMKPKPSENNINTQIIEVITPQAIEGSRSRFPKIKELEVTFLANPNEVNVILEMDKKELFGSSDKRVVSIPYDGSNFNYENELSNLLSQV